MPYDTRWLRPSANAYGRPTAVAFNLASIQPAARVVNPRGRHPHLLADAYDRELIGAYVSADGVDINA